MNDGTWEVKQVERVEIRDFVEKWHYSGSINGVLSTYCFGLYHNGELVGAMIYGRVGMAGAWKKYASSQDDILELRRLCCIDDTPKNTESFFIGKTLRWLKHNTKIKYIISYADSNHGHTGIIYQATNFKRMGLTSPGRVIIWGDRQYHDKTIRTMYKGKLKPFAQRVKTALEEGHAYYKKTTPKHIYLMEIKRKQYARESRPTNIQAIS